MRINRFVALAHGMSRRKADEAVAQGRVAINGIIARVGDTISHEDAISLDDAKLKLPNGFKTILLNKPVGYVCSRNGQGSKTIYDLLPKKYENLKPVGRLDKDSSGLIIMTNDGELAQTLSHPSIGKEKVYRVTLDRTLEQEDEQAIKKGINLSDGISTLGLQGHELEWLVRIREGRNRQIRRTFSSLNYRVIKLHRIKLGNYELQDLKSGTHRVI